MRMDGKLLSQSGQTTVEYILLLILIIGLLTLFKNLMLTGTGLDKLAENFRSRYQAIYKYGDERVSSPDDPWSKRQSTTLHPESNGRFFGPKDD